MKPLSRRNFIKTGGMLPLAGLAHAHAGAAAAGQGRDQAPVVRFYGDGVMLDPAAYAKLLQKLAQGPASLPDRYGRGGAVKRLEETFADITGKKRAVFMPSGTMANQLAVKVLSGERAKVFVQELSHVYRDEADAAQTVHSKRLIPLAKGRGCFTLEELEEAADYARAQEAFQTGFGAVSIENSVRRAYEEVFDFDEMGRIARYAREHGMGLHLDGARLYMASAYSGVSIKAYAALFDTVYISLYKYLGAGAGAILCGSENVIGTMPRLIKIYGGNMYQNWHNAAAALHVLDGFEERFARAKQKAADLFARLNRLEGIRVESFEHGSNVFKLYAEHVRLNTFRSVLAERFGIVLGGPEKESGFIPVKVNETQLMMANDDMVEAFRRAAAAAGV